MPIAYTLWDPKLGDIPLATALAATPVTGQALTNPVIVGGTADNLKIGDTTPTHAEFTTVQLGMLTATQTAALQKGLTVSGGDAILTTAQINCLASTQVTSFTANGAALVSIQVGTLTATSVAMFGLKTVGGTVGAVPSVKSVDTATGKMTVAATASDTSVYNVAVIG